jgi:hypothetical protein
VRFRVLRMFVKKWFENLQCVLRVAFDDRCHSQRWVPVPPYIASGRMDVFSFFGP